MGFEPVKLLLHALILTHLDEIVHRHEVVLRLHRIPYHLLMFRHVSTLFFHIRHAFLRIASVVVKLLAHRQHQAHRHHVHICHAANQVIVRLLQHLLITHLCRVILHPHAIHIALVQQSLVDAIPISRCSMSVQHLIHIAHRLVQRTVLRLICQHIQRVNLTLLHIRNLPTCHQAKERHQHYDKGQYIGFGLHERLIWVQR